MNEELFELSKVINQDIVDIIKMYQLDTPSRKQDLVSKRYYLYNYMSEHRHMTTTMIGRYFNRDHSSVVHGIYEHKYWYYKKDSRYLKYIHPLPDMIKAKRSDISIFDINVMPLCDEEARITITGNIPPKLLTKFEDKMTASDLMHIFEAHNFLRVNTGEGEQ